MIETILIKRLAELSKIPTRHSKGHKYVFLSEAETDTSLTQVAIGELMPGETTGFHSHESMEEYFYFLEGLGHFEIGEEDMVVQGGSFVRVPAAQLHQLSASGNSKLRFFYFGVAIPGLDRHSIY